jgi:hypothetical protein
VVAGTAAGERTGYMEPQEGQQQVDLIQQSLDALLTGPSIPALV